MEVVSFQMDRERILEPQVRIRKLGMAKHLDLLDLRVQS